MYRNRIMDFGLDSLLLQVLQQFVAPLHAEQIKMIDMLHARTPLGNLHPIIQVSEGFVVSSGILNSLFSNPIGLTDQSIADHSLDRVEAAVASKHDNFITVEEAVIAIEPDF